MKRLILSLSLLLFAGPVFGGYLVPNVVAQVSQYTLKLRIVDDAGIPLTGAVVRLAGASKGAIADYDGHATLTVPSGSKVTISFTGMKTVTLTVTENITRDIIMKEYAEILDGVVSTGYATTTKKRTTGSVSIVKADDIKFQPPTASVDLMLKGQVAGVDVKAISGKPGETGSIKIRGTNSITGNTEPLWVIDGVPIQNAIPDSPSPNTSQIKAGDFSDIFMNGLGSIPPGDIESISILKDASATAIYGSQAAGGVIVVTTKRGNEGRLRLNYSSNITLTTAPPRDVNLMSAREKIDFEKELWDEFSAPLIEAEHPYFPAVGITGAIRKGVGQYKDLTPEQREQEIEKIGNGPTTDWFKELFNPSISHSHYVSISGGSAKNKYYSSLSYNRNNGLVKGTNAESLTFSLKLDSSPSDKLKLSLSSDLSHNKSQSYAGQTDPFTYAYFANPYERPYEKDGSYRPDATWYSLPTNNDDKPLGSISPLGFNIFREMNDSSSDAKDLRGNIRGNLTYQFTDNLSFNGIAAVGYSNTMSDNILGKETQAAFIDRPFENSKNATSNRMYGSITQRASSSLSYMLRGQFNYFQTFGQYHHLSALIGSEIRSQYAKSIYEKRYGYDPKTGNSSTPTLLDAGADKEADIKKMATIIDGLSGQSRLENTFASFYLSADYSYRGRYVVSLTGRTDGSNNFGSKEQFNPTGSIGLAWNADEEAFMKKLQPYVSQLTVRLAGGYTGRVNRGVHPQLVMRYLPRLRTAGNSSYLIGQVSTPPNPKLRWEKTRDSKVGMDLGLFSNRLQLSVEAYDRYTTDAVSSVSVVSTTGYVFQSYNTSSILNRGLELTVSGTPYQNEDWRVFASANMGLNYNKLVSFDDPNPNYNSENVVGYPLSSIFSGKVMGIDPTLGIYTYQIRPGADVDTPAGRRNPNNYRYYIGTSSQPLNGGYSMSVSYKSLTVGMGGSFSAGGYVVNEVVPPVSAGDIRNRQGIKESIPHYVNDLYTYHLNTQKSSAHRWTPDNPIVDGNPRIIDRYGIYQGLDKYMVTASNITKASRLESLSYFKLGSLYATYTFDQPWVKRIGLQSISTSIQANNLLIITNYPGIDPETPGAVYPIPKTFTFGLSLSL